MHAGDDHVSARGLIGSSSTGWCDSRRGRNVIDMAATILWGRGRMCGSRAFLWRSPATRHINPFGQARAFLALDINNVRIAATTAAHAVLLLLVKVGPVLIFFVPLVFGGGLFKVWDVRKLARGGIGRAVLDGGVSVAKVAEVMDILDA